GAARRVHPAHRDRGQLGAGRDQCALQHGQVGRTTRSSDQPGAVLTVGDDQRIVHVDDHPPCTAVRTSTLAPGGTGVPACSARGTTVPSIATATPAEVSPSASSTSETVAPSAKSRQVPFT